MSEADLKPPSGLPTAGGVRVVTPPTSPNGSSSSPSLLTKVSMDNTGRCSSDLLPLSPQTGADFLAALIKKEFPGTELVVAHGSALFPTNVTGAQETSPANLLDLLLIINDHCLPSEENVIIGLPDERAWDVIDPSLRTAAQWHAANRQRHGDHYSRSLLRMAPLSVAKLQKHPVSPVLYLPFVKLPYYETYQEQPSAKDAERGVGRSFTRVLSVNPPDFEDRLGKHKYLWCKYGVVSASDFRQSLTSWKAFHLAGRLQKPFLALDPKMGLLKEIEGVGDDAVSVENSPAGWLWSAVQKNRLQALATALLLLPSHFTFGSLLYTILSLSYRGDIRFLFGVEDKKKIPQLLKAHCLLLADVYLDLLHQLNARLTSTPSAQLSFAEPPIEFLRLPSPLSASGSGLSADVKKQLKDIRMQREHHAPDGLFGRGTFRDQPKQSECITNHLQEALLSDSFMLKQGGSDVYRKALYLTLPLEFQNAASSRAASARMGRLFSPNSLLSQKALGTALGKPDPFDTIPIRAAVEKLTRRASIVTAWSGLRANGLGTSMRYVLHKMMKRCGLRVPLLR